MLTGSKRYIQSIKRLASEITIEAGTFLVTGASGLIGSCLIDVLIEANRSYGRRFAIYAAGRNAERLRERFCGFDEVQRIVQDVAQPIQLPGIDYIIHTASNADPRSYALYPSETILTNVMGAKNVLDYCRENGARALLTSSFEIYGKLNQDEYSEQDYGIIDLDLIRSCYPESKRCAELLFKSYFDEYGTDAVIVRLPSVYGPTMLTNDSKAHAQFLRNAIAGQNIVLKSKGTQKRTYCYVMDAVSAILKILIKGKAGEAYNIANSRSIATIAEVACCIANQAGTEVIYDLPDSVESKGFSRPQNCVLKAQKLEALGWQGRYSLEQGLSETLEILRDLSMNGSSIRLKGK